MDSIGGKGINPEKSFNKAKNIFLYWIKKSIGNFKDYLNSCEEQVLQLTVGSLRTRPYIFFSIFSIPNG